MMRRRQLLVSVKKRHFLCFSVSPDLLRRVRTLRTSEMCSACDLENIKMSAKYMYENFYLTVDSTTSIVR